MPKPKNPEDIKRPERTYTLEEKETAIALTLKNGSIASASRMLDIPSTSIHNWLRKMEEDGELATIRTAIRVRVVEKAWGGTLRALASLIREYDRLTKSRDEVDGKTVEPYTPETLVDIATVAEKMTRVLKNIGDVAQKMEMTGEVKHIIEKMGGEGLTTEKIQEIGRQAMGKRWN